MISKSHFRRVWFQKDEINHTPKVVCLTFGVRFKILIMIRSHWVVYRSRAFYFRYSLQSVSRMSPLRVNVSCMAKAADRQ